jgi:rhodanese-related sulfurtransferase
VNVTPVLLALGGLIIVLLVRRLLFGGNYTTIGPTAAAELLKGANAVILDVRTKGEAAGGRIKGAKNIPMAELERRVAEVPKGKKVLIYCASGMRSRVAARFLEKRGYADLYNLSGGIAGWHRQGLPLVR